MRLQVIPMMDASRGQKVEGSENGAWLKNKIFGLGCKPFLLAK